MNDEKKLMDFVKSLENRGLLNKPMEQFDYEWVVWDYLKKNSNTTNIGCSILHQPSSCSNNPHCNNLHQFESFDNQYKKCVACGLIKLIR